MIMKSLLGATFGLLAGALLQTAGAADVKGGPTNDGTCSAEQLATIDGAFRLAEIRLAEAIQFLDANPRSPHVQRYFGDMPRKMIRLSLTLTQAALPAGQRPNLACNRSNCGTEFGYAIRPRNEITFCPAFFAARTEGLDSRYGVVVHETSHLAAGTRDAAYFPSGTAALTKAHPEITVMNAESLEQFVELMPR